MSAVTKNLSRYIEKRGFNLAKISEGTGIPYSALYSSLRDKKRERSLRDDELIAVCVFIGIDPRLLNAPESLNSEEAVQNKKTPQHQL